MLLSRAAAGKAPSSSSRPPPIPPPSRGGEAGQIDAASPRAWRGAGRTSDVDRQEGRRAASPGGQGRPSPSIPCATSRG
eukprot:6527516-Pyramimonas_sp.AAC.1